MTTPQKIDKIVVIESDPSVAEALHHLAEDAGLVGASFSSPSEALDFVENEGTDIVLIDYKLSSMSQIEVATQLRVKGWTGEIILLVDEPEDVSQADTERLQIGNVIKKWRSNELLPSLLQKFQSRSA